MYSITITSLEEGSSVVPEKIDSSGKRSGPPLVGYCESWIKNLPTEFEPNSLKSRNPRDPVGGRVSSQSYLSFFFQLIFKFREESTPMHLRSKNPRSWLASGTDFSRD